MTFIFVHSPNHVLANHCMAMPIKALGRFPTKVDKEYGYIADIQREIFTLRYQSPVALRGIERQKRMGSSITPQAPPDTAEIVRQKK